MCKRITPRAGLVVRRPDTGEILPPDFICPLCKHGAADFEPLK